MSYFDHFALTKPTNIGKLVDAYKIRNEFNQILPFLQKTKKIKILEIGPGKGELAKLFIDYGYSNYYVVEPNKEMREAIIPFVVGAKRYKIPKIREKNESYDIILLFDVFEHLNGTEEAAIFISEAYRVLRSDGRLIIFSPDLVSWGIDFWHCDYTHSNPTSIRRTTQLFSNYSFKILYKDYFYFGVNHIVFRIISFFVKKLIPSIFGDSSYIIFQRLYKLKLNFLGRFLIIGKKV